MATAVGGYLLTQTRGGWLIHQLGGVTLDEVQAEIAKHPGSPGPKGDLGTSAVAAMPAGAVVAFNLQSGCPTELGWDPYKRGAGRMIIGAGDQFENGLGEDDFKQPLLKPPYDIPHGAVGYVLTEDNLPRIPIVTDTHIHEFGTQGDTIVAKVRVLDDSPTPAPQHLIATINPSGRQALVPTMPPYIALYLCERRK